MIKVKTLTPTTFGLESFFHDIPLGYFINKAISNRISFKQSLNPPQRTLHVKHRKTVEKALARLWWFCPENVRRVFFGGGSKIMVQSRDFCTTVDYLAFWRNSDQGFFTPSEWWSPRMLPSTDQNGQELFRRSQWYLLPSLEFLEFPLVQKWLQSPIKNCPKPLKQGGLGFRGGGARNSSDEPTTHI